VVSVGNRQKESQWWYVE